jgi:Forkhead domain/FHA domain
LIEQKKKKKSEIRLMSSSSSSKKLWEQAYDDHALQVKRWRAAQLRKRRARRRKSSLSECENVLESEALVRRQSLLYALQQRRAAQRLPPFFCVLSGPTLKKSVRVEELKVTLGRHSGHCALADMHVASARSVSHVHASIEYVKRDKCYYLINNSKNGVAVRCGGGGGEFVALTEQSERVALANPSTIDICGALVYFQIFYVCDADVERWRDYADDTPASAKPSNRAAAHKANKAKKKSESKKKEKKSTKSSSGGAAPQPTDDANVGGDDDDDDDDDDDEPSMPRTYAAMITQALVVLDGSGTLNDIAEWVERRWPAVSKKNAWRNSISGILSSNSRFEATPVTLATGKRARWSLWRFRNHGLEVAQLREKERGEKERSNVQEEEEEEEEEEEKKKNSDAENTILMIDDDAPTIVVAKQCDDDDHQVLVDVVVDEDHVNEKRQRLS